MLAAVWEKSGRARALPALPLPTPLNLLDQADIVVLTEHWLWPYSLHELDSLHPDFSSAAVTDDRLNFNSNLTRGCGGVAILWRKSLCVISIQVESDRIVVVRVRTVNCDSLTIIGTYMPDTSQPLEKYTECLT